MRIGWFHSFAIPASTLLVWLQSVLLIICEESKNIPKNYSFSPYKEDLPPCDKDYVGKCFKCISRGMYEVLWYIRHLKYCYEIFCQSIYSQKVSKRKHQLLIKLLELIIQMPINTIWTIFLLLSIMLRQKYLALLTFDWLK